MGKLYNINNNIKRLLIYFIFELSVLGVEMIESAKNVILGAGCAKFLTSDFSVIRPNVRGSSKYKKMLFER